MNEEELRREIIREQRIHDGRVEAGILPVRHRLRYPYLYPFGDEDEEEEADNDEEL